MEIAKFIGFARSYDPANFQLIYALKATFAITLNGFLGFYFFNLSGAIFAVNITMGIFFLSALECPDLKKFGFLSLYITMSCAFMPFVTPLIEIGIWLSALVFVWAFFVAISTLYSENLNKILLAVNMTGLVGFIVQTTAGLNVKDGIGGLILGGVLAIFMKLGRFAKYGDFTKKSINILLDDAIIAASDLGSAKFESSSRQMLGHIKNFKSIFANESVNLKDVRLIRNHSRAVFYLYKIEEIAYLLISLDSSFRHIQDAKLLTVLRAEILENLSQLKGLFKGLSPQLRYEALNLAKASEYKIFASSLDVLYTRFALIKDSGEDRLILNKAKKTSLKSAISMISLKDATTLSALRLAFCLAAAIFISQITHIDHGIWIAIAVMSMSKNSRYMVKTAGKDNVLGGLFGFFIALGLIYVFGANFMIYIACVVGMFCVYYFRAYSQFAFATSFMVEFTMIFYLIKNDFLELMLHRLIDVVIGFSLVFVVSFLGTASDDEELRTKLKAALKNFIDFIQSTLIKNEKHSFALGEQSIIDALSGYEQMLKQDGNLSKAKLESAGKICDRLNELNIEFIKLRNYLKTMSEDEREAIRSPLSSDIKMLCDRFEMLDKKIDSLPYYFLENAEEKLLCKDEKIVKLLGRIILKQNDIYSLTSL